MATGHGKVEMEDPTLAGGFCLLPVILMEQAGLTVGAKYAWTILYWFAFTKEEYPGHKEAASRFGVGETSLRRYLSELEKRGIIEVSRPGLGQTNSYILPTLKLDVQGVQIGRSRRPNRASFNEQEVVNKKNDTEPSSSLDNHNDKTAFITALAAEFAPQENVRAILTYLGNFAPTLIEQAAEMTRAHGDGLDKPIAYLYGTLQQLVAEETFVPLYHERAQPLPELTEEERAASLEALDRVKADLRKKGII